jgi:hypothetical protein
MSCQRPRRRSQKPYGCRRPLRSCCFSPTGSAQRRRPDDILRRGGQRVHRLSVAGAGEWRGAESLRGRSMAIRPAPRKKSWSATTVRSSRSSHTGVQDGRSDRHGARDDRSRFGCRRFSIRRLRQHPQVKSCGGGSARVDGGPSHSPANISRLFPKKKSERVAGGTAQATPVAANRITVRSTWAYRANRDPLRIGGLCCCNMDQAAHP